MKPIALCFSLTLLLSFPPALRAQEAEGLSDSDMEALRQTQELLENPALRQNYLKENAEASKVDQKVRQLGASKENTEEIYKISSDIAATLVKKTGGDSAKLQQLLQEALKNPEAFAGELTPEQIRRIKKVSEKIDAQNVKKP
jgi:hypothetical protein